MGVLKRKQTLLGKEGIGPAFARGQRVRDRWESFLEVTLVSRIELHSVRAIGLGDRPETVPLQLKQPTLAVEPIAHKPRHHRCDHLFVRGLGNSSPSNGVKIRHQMVGQFPVRQLYDH